MSDTASEIARLRRAQYGHSSERRTRLTDQMEPQRQELEAAATEDEIAATTVARASTSRPSSACVRPANRSRILCRARGS